MSLRVWLPLNGTLENKGCDNVTVTNSGAIVDANGKTGSCYSKDSADYISVKNVSPLQDVWSACCWFNRSSECEQTGSAYIICMNGGNTSNFTFAIMDYNGKLSAYFASTSSSNRKISNFTIERDTWYHVCLTYDGTNGKLYANGNLVLSIANPSTPSQNTQFMIGGRFGLGGDIIMKANDVRVYDHALSAAEVHEISQGLVRHYKLDDAPFVDNTNYLSKATAFSQTSTFKKISFTQAEIDAISGKEVTISIDAKSEAVGTSCDCYFRSSSGSVGVGYTMTNISSEYQTYTFTTVAPNGGFITFAIRNNSGSGSSTTVPYYYDNISIKKTYSVLNNDPNVIIDSSGYGKHGTIIGTTTVDNTSPRYSSATHMNAKSTTNHIEAESLPSTVQTVSLWVKSTLEGSPVIYIDPLSLTCLCLSSSGIAAVQKASSKKTAFSLSNYSTTSWNHMVVTRDGTQYGLWINGVQASASGSTYWTHNGDLLYLFNRNLNSSYGADASISDFRAYVTLLSENDILALYRTGAKIDKSNCVHAYEFWENDKESITINGQVIGHNAFEICPTLHYDKTIYIEPDGSKWVRIFHHNAPTEVGLFSSTDTFATGVYIDADRWYDVEPFIGHMSVYEFIIKQKLTAEDTETKYRWVQTVSPLTATYEDVSPSSGNVTYNTSTGYESVEMGGLLYGTGSNTRMRIANEKPANWFGAIGGWNLSSGSLPAFPNTRVSTGYFDLYARIDNLPDLCAKIIKNQGIYGTQIIEI